MILRSLCVLLVLLFSGVLLLGAEDQSSDESAPTTDAKAQTETEDQSSTDDEDDSDDADTDTDEIDEADVDWRKHLSNGVRKPGKKRGRLYQKREKTKVDYIIEAGEEAEEEVIDMRSRRVPSYNEQQAEDPNAPHGPVRVKTPERREKVDRRTTRLKRHLD